MGKRKKARKLVPNRSAVFLRNWIGASWQGGHQKNTNGRDRYGCQEEKGEGDPRRVKSVWPLFSLSPLLFFSSSVVILCCDVREGEIAAG